MKTEKLIITLIIIGVLGLVAAPFMIMRHHPDNKSGNDNISDYKFRIKPQTIYEYKSQDDPSQSYSVDRIDIGTHDIWVLRNSKGAVSMVVR